MEKVKGGEGRKERERWEGKGTVALTTYICAFAHFIDHEKLKC